MTLSSENPNSLLHYQVWTLSAQRLCNGYNNYGGIRRNHLSLPENIQSDQLVIYQLANMFFIIPYQSRRAALLDSLQMTFLVLPQDHQHLRLRSLFQWQQRNVYAVCVVSPTSPKSTPTRCQLCCEVQGYFELGKLSQVP